MAVRFHDGHQLFLGHHTPQRRRTGVHNLHRIKTSDTLQPLHQSCDKDILPYSQEHGPAKLLHEEHEAHAQRDILLTQHRLRYQRDGLEPSADADTIQNLVSDPLCLARAGRHGRQHACADGTEDAGEDECRDVVPYLLRDDGGHDTNDDETQDEGKRVDAGLHCRLAFCGLEPDGEVVDDGHHGAGDKEHVEHCAGHRAVENDAGGGHGGGWGQGFEGEEGEEEDGEGGEEADDGGGGPGVGGAAPLEGEEEADKGGDEEQEAERVELFDLVKDREWLAFG